MVQFQNLLNCQLWPRNDKAIHSMSLACTVNIQINGRIDERPLLSRTDAMMCNHEAFDISVVKNQ